MNNPKRETLKILIRPFLMLVFLKLTMQVMTGQTFKLPNPPFDTTYYESYTEELTSRAYSSVKFLNFGLINGQEGTTLRYNTNHKFILGLGVNYSIFGLNIGLNFPFVNHDDDKYGPSHYLDLQSHIYARRYNIDLYLQNYEGYYVANPDKVFSGWPASDTFPKSTDMNTMSVGFNVQYMFNYKRFSFKAAFNQNEWQKKSAGSFVVGTNFLYMISSGDSSLIPVNIHPPDGFDGITFKRSDILNTGVSGGYYYTLVIASHAFISAGLAAGPSAGLSWLDVNDKQVERKSGLTIGLNGVFRAAAGYNSRRFFVGVSFFQQLVLNQIPGDKTWEYFHTGNLRFNIAYRFTLNKPIKFFNPRYW